MKVKTSEVIVVTKDLPTEDKERTGDLVQVGSFCVARYKVTKDEYGYVYSLPWIPSMNKWDHVYTSVPSGDHIPYTKKRWNEFLRLSKALDKMNKSVRALALKDTRYALIVADDTNKMARSAMINILQHKDVLENNKRDEELRRDLGHP